MTEENQVQHTNLSDILSGDLPTEEPQPVQTETEPEKAEAEPQTGEKVEETQPEESPSSEENAQEDSPTVPLKALESERHKRQDLERRLAALESQNAQQTDEPEYDPLLEPEKYVEDSIEKHQSTVTNELFQMRCEMSQEMMRSQVEDYDEVEKIFLEAAQENPALSMQLRQSPMPAKFAYQEGQRLKFLKSIGDDPKSYEQKIREEERAKVLEELKAQSSDEEKSKAVEAAPKSLADAPNTAPRKGPEPETHTPLDQLL